VSILPTDFDEAENVSAGWHEDRQVGQYAAHPENLDQEPRADGDRTAC
jgi:hypothetical protein